MVNGSDSDHPWPLISGSTAFNCNSIPPGYRFQPTDTELLVHYLKRKLLCKPLPMDSIREVQIYDYSPQQLTEMYDSRDNAWYFFTKRDKKSAKASRPNRIITGNNGYWKTTGPDVPVKDGNGKLVGYKRPLVYYEGGMGKIAKKTDWLMKEYTFDKMVNASVETKFKSWVLCKIHNKKIEISKRKSEENHNETEMKRSKKQEENHINETMFAIPNECSPDFQDMPELPQPFPCNYESTTCNACGTSSCGDYCPDLCFTPYEIDCILKDFKPPNPLNGDA